MYNEFQLLKRFLGCNIGHPSTIGQKCFFLGEFTIQQ